MIIVKAPLRLPFGGGGTDLYSWYKKNNSFFLTAAINKFIYITLSERDVLNDYWISYSKVENVKNIKDIKHTIINKILQNYKLKKGIEVHTISEVPSNSGMGSSGAVAVGLIRGLDHLFKKKISNKATAEKAFNIEMNINKKHAGKQDQYASSIGGFISVKIDKAGKTMVKKLKISKLKLKKLEKNIFLIYLKKKRFAVNIIKKQSKLLNTKKSKIILMKQIQKLAYRSKKILENENLDKLGFVFDEHWQLKKKFGNFMSDQNIDKLYDKLKQFGSTGGKIIGAGGGGFLMMYVPKKSILSFKKKLKKNKINFLQWRFYNKGAEIITHDQKS